MNELRTLLSLELRACFGINKFRYTRDPKTKRRYRGLSVVWVLLVGVIFTYVGALVYGLCTLGLSDIVPAYLAVLTSLLLLMFGLFTAGHRMFGQSGYDLLASMPIRAGTLVLSRFLAMYAEDLLLTLAIWLPGMVVYGLCQRPAIGCYPLALIAALCIPAIPLVIATLLGTLILAISARMQHKSLVQTVLMVLLVVGGLLGSFLLGNTAEAFTAAQFAQLAQTVSETFGRLYPPAMWLNDALTRGNLAGLGLFILVSAGVMAAAVWIVAANFHAIQRRLRNVSARHNYKIGAMAHRSLLKALYVREAKRYFSSSIYVVNTILGPILGAVMAVALAITGLDTLQNALPIPVDIPGMLPFVFAAVFCMMTTTSVAISMEGREFWVVKSLPVPTKTLLDSKILLNLTLMLPFYGISAAAMAIALRPDPLQFLWLLGIPLSLILFVVVLGITVNLKFHSFDWEKEEAVVKQSLPAMLGGFAGLFLSVLLGGVVFLLPAQYADIAKLLICLLLWVGTACLYRKNNTAALDTL